MDESKLETGMSSRHGVTVSGKPAAYYIELLFVYAQQEGLVTIEDFFVVRNALFELFDVEKPTSDRIYRRDNPLKIDDALAPLIEIGVSSKLCGGSPYEREQFGTKVMGLLTPRQSEITSKFREYIDASPQTATDWYFAFSKACGYIKEGNSIRWRSDTEFGQMELTINLAKPEKDPRQIAADKEKSASSKGAYPKCLLCPQTSGYAGKSGFPARQNHRPIRIKGIAGTTKTWYFQYSPYQYYNEHCILIFESHIPMKIDRRTFVALFDFIEEFPHYFIGSNADLPIVGGSILSHEHYQGGRHTFPIESAEEISSFRHGDFDVEASIINWPLSTVRLRGTCRKTLKGAAMLLLDTWKSYDDGVIVPFTFGEDKRESGITASDEPTPHNTLTPILRRKNAENGEFMYELDVVLRNNLTSEKHPLGIYHPHSDVWHIKKENIGLIEVMGLAVLPPRLAVETAKIREILQGKLPLSNKTTETYPELEPHWNWVCSLAEVFGTQNSEAASEEIVRNGIGAKFARVLRDCGVFGTEGEELERFESFMEYAGFRRRV